MEPSCVVQRERAQLQVRQLSVRGTQKIRKYFGHFVVHGLEKLVADPDVRDIVSATDLTVMHKYGT